MPFSTRLLFCLTLLFFVLQPQSACCLLAAEGADSEGIRFFEQKIRPVLVTHCYECHSEKSKPLQGGLQLDFQEAILTGGDSGPALVSGKPDESLILETMLYGEETYQMPPKGKLPDSVIADFRRWIEMGAPDPRKEGTMNPVRTGFDMAARRQFWSFQPPKSTPAPEIENKTWPQNKIDYYILEKLEQAGLSPAEPADKQTLIRRVYYDLTGLPPSFQQAEKFIQDSRQDAYARLVDQLLASPHFGERWARHWLDVVRYAEDNVNMGPHNGPYRNAFRYRDWVVSALNADIPYDEFIKRQLATDFLPETGPEDYPAMGLLGLSPQYHKELQLSKMALDGQYVDEWEDRVDVVSRGLLGLTVACARCHDHKYDPITAQDYHALAGIFASIRQTTRPILPAEEVAKSQPQRDEVNKLLGEIDLSQKAMVSLRQEVKENPQGEAAKKTSELKKLIESHKKQIEAIKKSTPDFDIAMADAVTEEQIRIEEQDKRYRKIVYLPNTPRDIPVYVRGNISNPGEIVPRRFLEILSPQGPKPFVNGSGRLELAEAIIDRNNPLTARVFVNRIWLKLFGEGLVDSPSNFGETGSAPSHPELLDDLAVRFMEQGWSTKKLIREILLSATYQQASSVPVTELALQVDPDNRLLSRFNRRRLDAEAYYDSLQLAGGQIDLTLGGPSGDIDSEKFNRRAIYAKISRNNPSKFLQVHDFPDPTIHAERRSLTTTSLQQLFVINSPFVKQQAVRLAGRISSQLSLQDRISAVYQTLFGREPSSTELEIGLQYLISSGLDQTPPAHHVPPSFTGNRVQTNLSELGDRYSVELWFRNEVPYEERAISGYIFSRGQGGAPGVAGDHLGIMGSYRPGKEGRLIFWNGDKHRVVLHGETKLDLNEWYHLVFIREGKHIRIHLDGNPLPEIEGDADISYNSPGTELFLGGRSDKFANFRGQLGSFSVYDRPLSLDEIQAHFQRAALKKGGLDTESYSQTVLESRPLSYWLFYHMDQLKPIIPDLSSNGHHGNYEGTVSETYNGDSPWVLYCHALLCSNELQYVD